MSGVTLRVTTDAGLVMVEVSAIEPAARVPVDICAVVDVSGSMGAEANIKDERGVEIRDGLTVLDVVKHALRTIAHALGERDTFSLVSFSTLARVVVESVCMSDAGKAKALEGIDSLRADGQTNLWDGIRVGRDALRAATKATEATEASARVRACFVLTDGQPNIVPPSGHIAALSRSVEATKFVVPVHTFGFGREADSVLLDEIAQETDAMFAFIPDASLVGSVFISALANLFTTLATTATLRVELEEPHGAAPVEVKLGALHQEQTRAVVLSASAPTRVTLRYSVSSVSSEISLEAAELSAESARVRVELARQTAAARIRRCVELGKHGNLGEAQAEARRAALDAGCCPGLLADITGQVMEAVSSKTHFERWGRHYLLSLSSAHARQVANNCKDPGVQEYGGPVFRAIRDSIEDVFLSIPPPVPSHRMNPAVAVPVDMGAYMDDNGPCFGGGGLVAMHDGSLKMVSCVRKGDVVIGGYTVVCVVRTERPTRLSLVGSLLVTDWHPIRAGAGGWAFPCMVPGATTAASDAVYNFVLDKGHEVTIEGTACVTLGHGLEGDVVSHAYFGTSRVVDDLRGMRGWADGLVAIIGALRGTAGGLVCGLVAAPLF